MRLTADQLYLRSEYADDADMKAIISLFVDELPKRTLAMQEAISQGDRERLRMLAHRLKGAAGGYGFPQIGEAAALVEAAVKEDLEPNVVRSRMGTLVALAARVRE